MATDHRLKSKMKRSDPNDFSIHDFLDECKTGDAADSRFDDSATSARNPRNTFVLGAPSLKVGNLYRLVSEKLAAERGWVQRKDSDRFHFIIGGPRGSGIPFKRLAQLYKWDYGIVPHCNYIRGHIWITQKVKLLQVLRTAGLEALAPESFLFFPSTAEDNETDDFRAASESSSKRATANKWIAKATDASRGERTLLSEDYDAIVSHIDAQDKTSPAWIVQRYITNPLLLPGGRKFDLRYFVLVDANMNFYICPRPVLKVCADKFSVDDLSNKLAHLSTAAVQGRQAEDYPAEQFTKWLASEHGASYEATVLPSVRDAVSKVLEAARPKLESADHADFTSFQIFAFDFILDDSLKLWFLEVCAPTDFPDHMVDELASDVVELAVKPVFDSARDARDAPTSGRAFQVLETTASAPRSNNSKK
mmetsp:Transcript_3884/g.12234  ORF Transcript_3884/g.12234 Transcript_3884/m.12234 type:complete len:421 (-) Transcript_3884:678-1940(-)